MAIILPELLTSLEPDTEPGDFNAQHPLLEAGAGFVLFVRDGAACFLEGDTYRAEPWPNDGTLFVVA